MDEDDPNPLIHQHSYNFTFGDGTEIIGSSDENVVTVTVSDATFDLHISCSDDFPGGFGRKDGPKADQIPEEFPVSHYTIWKYRNVGKPSCELREVCSGPSTDPPTDESTTQSTKSKPAKPTASPSILPFGRPSSKPSSGPSRDPTGTSHPTSVVTANPSLAPSTKPTAKPSLRFSSLPSIQPVSVPHSVPSSEPTRFCVDEDDPNPLIHQHSYNFTFGDGTEIIGSSDENVVTVTVSDATFDLHISCSDDFPGGFGRKDGPKADQIPEEFPVSHYTIWKYRNVGKPSCELREVCSGPSTDPPTDESTTQSTRSKPAKPTASPSILPFGRPSSKPSSGPSRDPTGTSHPTSVVTANPSLAPSTKPTAKPSLRFSSLPSIQPVSVPHSVPSSEPTRFCVDEDDPNPLIHQHSYNFTFGDGTEIIGSSDENVVTVTVSDATFDLHISCSDDFPGGFGRKDGPKADQIPEEFPVSHYTIWKYRNVGKPSCELREVCSGPSTDPPTDESTTQSTKSKPAKPTASPSILPFGRPSSKPSSGPSRDPTGTSHPTSVVTANPSLAPSTKPTAKPSLRFSSLPSIQPVSVPHSVPSSEPTRFCVDEDDPNPLIHQHSYNFTFGDGTEIIGSSDENVVTVTVSDATFDLHISCSDDFPGGFGRKDGPKADQIPEEFPVSHYTIWKYRNVGKPSCELREVCSGPSTDPPTDESTTQSTRSKPAKPTASPSILPFGRPSSKPSSGPSRDPTGTSHPTSVVTANPSLAPSTKPTAKPSLRFSSLPSIQPVSVPHSVPSSEPTRFCVDEDDPNPLIHQHSYNFTFGDGTEIIGSSDENVVTVTVSDATFDLHISCSDDFPGGFGRKDGPKADQIPEEFPVSHYTIWKYRNVGKPSCELREVCSGPSTDPPTDESTTQSTKSKPAKPTASPSILPFGRPSSKPSSGPSRDPTGTSHPTSVVTANPSLAPSTNPTAKPSLRFSSLPSIQPVSVPHSVPSSEPTRFCVDEDDPNPLIHQHSYNFTFGDGTEIIGSSDENVVTVTVSDATFDLHISCSDDFPGGFGRKDGPKADQIPEEFPVSHYTIWKYRNVGKPSCELREVCSGPSTDPPTDDSTTQSTKSKLAKPTASPSILPFGRPSSKPSSGPSRDPTGTSHPTSVVTANPSLAPSTKPTAKPSLRFSSLPSIQPVSVPHSVPSSEPTRFCVDEDDPNPLIHQHSYNFTFGDGTEIIGSSDENVVTVTVSDATFDLHISCSDDFPGGFGRKDGPKADQIPEEFPVSHYTIWKYRNVGKPSCELREVCSGPSTDPPTDESTTQSTRSKPAKPTASPSILPFGRPSSKPSSGPSRDPTGTSHPTSVVTANPSLAPSTKPTAKPSLRFSSLPSIQPVSVPHSVPSSEPTRFCVDEDDPNPLIHQHSYNFTFGDGTEIIGSSDENVVTVTVSDATFDLHISCSDDFPGGFGRKDGPKADQIPEEFPVSHYTIWKYRNVGKPSCELREVCSGPSTDPPTDESTTQSTKSKPAKPTASPSILPFGRPSSKPSSGPSRDPTGTSHPTSVVTANPSLAPSTNPTAKPSLRFSSLPSIQPVSVPHSVPSSEPTRFCVDEDDPNPLIHQHSYNFTFGDGTEIIGSSDENVVTVTVSDATFDLHISCSDDFPGGFGRKDGPKADQIPEEFPVSHYTIWKYRNVGKPSCELREVCSGPSTDPPTDDSTTQSTKSKLAKPTASPSILPFGRPSSKPSSGPSRDPTGTSHPTSVVTANPSLAPSTKPTAKPSLRFSSLPSIQPVSVPHSVPSSEPTRFCVGEDDPNPLIHQHSYNFTFGDGTEIIGSSDENVVTVTVSDATFDLHISCSDDFPGGFGRKDGPKADQIPEEFPVSHYTIWKYRNVGKPSCELREVCSGPSTDPPTDDSTTQSTKSKPAKPTASPSILPFGRPSSKPSSGPSRDPTGTSHPTSVVTANPSLAPSTNPTAKPSLRFSSLPSIQPVSVPHSVPSSEPTRFCVDEDDPNPLIHQHSYNFTFGDGTEIIGSSDENVVTVTVSDATFDLHISCSDDFPGGFGRKDGPKADQIPEEFPVSHYTIWKYRNVGKPSCELREVCSGPSTDPPTDDSTTQSTKSKLAKPTASPSILPFGRPSSKPSSGPSRDPTGTSHPTSVVTANPSLAPSTKPTAKPSLRFSSLPSIQPVSVPHSVPSSEPTRFCVGEDDPNPLIHQHSYNFTFGDGTEIIGSSDENVVTVTVSDATFDLHISCSDDFPGGFGRKDGPKADQIPEEFPVSHYTIWKYRNVGKPSCELREVCSGPSTDPPTDDSTTQSTKSKPAKPTASPSILPFGRPSSKPSSGPSRDPTGTSHPTSVVTANPSLAPSTNPTAKPSLRFSSLPSIQPVSVPHSVPSSEPTRFCVDEDDPNPLIHQHSYNFTFGDGTEIIGSSDENVVTVTVSDATFDLHISCSDDFPGGFGRKDGPKADQIPEEFPVSHYTIWKYRNVGKPSCELREVCSGPSTDPPTDDSTTQSTKSKPAKPTASPSILPFGRPSSKPSSGPSRDPTGTSHPTSVVTANPSLAPSTKPTAKPSLRFSSLPSIQPVSVPHSVPSSEPTRFCVGEDDPNPLIHQHSYNFTFGDGTEIIGSSDENVVTVTVSDATFDLHISCSDDFPGGFGRKDGPKADQIPEEFPVSHYTIWKYRNVGKPSCELREVCSGPSTDPPTDDSTTQSTKSKPAKPTASPSILPFGRPSSKPSSGPSRDPTGTSHPTSVVTANPSLAPSTNPTAKPSLRFSSLPSIQPVSVPILSPLLSLHGFVWAKMTPILSFTNIAITLHLEMAQKSLGPVMRML